MRLSEIFNALASGELSNLYVSDEQKELRPEMLGIILRSINLGLSDLYTRFLLKRKVVEFPSQVNQQVYTINQDDLIEILEVSFNHRGLELNSFDGYSLLDTKRIHLGFVPNDVVPIHVIYKAKHRQLNQDDINQDSDIELPSAYLNALLYFIASRLFVSIPNQLDGDLNEGIRYQQKYHAELAMLTEQGIVVDDLYENTWFQERGFV